MFKAAQNPLSINLRSRLHFFVFILLTAAMPLSAQNLPDRILGYKVHKTNITVDNSANAFQDNGKSDALVSISEPKLEDVSLTGITLSVFAAIKALDQSGKVDFLTFHDFRVYGIPVEIEKYDTPFSFTKNEPVNLPKPATLFLPTTRLLKAAWNETTNAKDTWDVTGRIFVFGKFRKMGFNFKRVVPVDVRLTIKNPLKK